MAGKGLVSATILASALLVVALSIEVEFPSNSDDLDGWMSANIKPFDARPSDAQMNPELAAAEEKKKVVTVKQDGSGDFKTVTDALESIPSENKVRTTIKIGPGVYKEKIWLDRSRPYITFYGENANDMPKLTFDGTAAKYGTVQSASVMVESDYFMAVNIIFENSAPAPRLGVIGAQAVAMTIGGDMAAFYNCKFYGYQDTLCDQMGRHFFKDCFIQGTVDFIFGNGRSIYLNCELHSVGTGEIAITAQARKSLGDKGGFSFVHCKITGTGNVMLSRAWMQNSRVVFAYTFMDSLVNPKGWDDWGFKDRHQTVYYGEYKCMGPGAVTDGRVKFGKILNDKQAKPFISTTFIHAASWLLSPPKL